MKGTWTGFYIYDKERIRKAIGFEKTGFIINIEVFNNGNFEGSVTDDETTGEMKETGKIIGTITNSNVHFRKYMPTGYEIHPDGINRPTGKKHSTLYYSGTLSEDKSIITGRWKFKRKIIFIFGFLPILYNPGSGTWSMSCEKNP